MNQTDMTGADGWYRIDFGCPDTAWVGFNTTFLNVSRAGYDDGIGSVGRGVYRVSRLDLTLKQR